MTRLLHITAVATGYSVLLTGAAIYVAARLGLIPQD